ncbi:MAG TPA: Uma2 family endonuclease [Planctomycetota bacterium]|jgi:Uma2 family endonuclease
MPVPMLARGPLFAGDYLTREEFIRRWNQMPELKRAELIGGVVYMPSPLSVDHSSMDSLVSWWLRSYANETPGCESGQNATWYMLNDAPQPDVHLCLRQNYGGQSFVLGNFFHGAPEMAAEVSLSTSSYDLHQKKELYAKAGVKEYLTVLIQEKAVRWGRLVGEAFQDLTVWPDGTTRSLVFPGLWLDSKALLQNDTKGVLKALNRGLKSREHTVFVQRLSKIRRK